MGINYSLCIIVPRERASDLLSHFSELLDDDGQAKLQNLRWSPESESRRATTIGTDEIDARGVFGLDRADSDSPNSYCLSLQLQLEPAMQELLGDHGFSCFDQPGPFGCMWTSVYAGAEYILLEMTAATSGMSRVIQNSELIHSAWIDFAKKSNAIFAYVYLEDETALQLFPNYGDLILPDFDTLTFDGDYRFSIDLMAKYLINSNRG